MYRTYSLEAVFPGARYEITASGRLELLVCNCENHSDPNTVGMAGFIGILTPAFTGERRDINCHGWLKLSGIGRAKFTDGLGRIGRVPANARNAWMSEEILWESLLDGRYKVMVIRTGPYRGEWSLHEGERVLDRQNVGLAYDALFGPDVDDVADWQQRAIRSIERRDSSSG